MPATVDYAVPDIQLDYRVQHNGTRTDGQYAGFDRFGRVIKQAWVDGAYTTHGSSGSVPNIPPIVEMAYAYDRVGNVLSAYDARPGAAQERSHEYDYDTLYRLKEAERGLWDGSAFTKKADSQRFTQDMLNNFTRIETDADGADGYEADEIEDRDHFSDANELLGRDTDNDGTDEIEIEYDLNGNTTCTDDTPGGGSRLIKYRYDAWNRLVGIDHEEGESTFPVAAYQYNALHHRVLVRVDRDPEDSTHTLNQQRVLYYSPAWQVLEERIDDDWSAESSTVDRHVQHVWGAFRGYIDDILLHREDGNADGDYNDAFDSTWYHLTDPQFSTVAILNLSGAVIERVSYDAWGEPRHHPRHDLDGDGDFDQDDADALDDLISSGSVPITSSKYRPEMDIDRDGDVDSTDQTLRGTTFVAALPKGALSTPGPGSGGGVDSTVGWSGYRYDQPTRLYAVRFRFYDAVTFRWLNRDPAGYVDSMNLYGYGFGSGIGITDPSGLGWIGDAWDWFQFHVLEGNNPVHEFVADNFWRKIHSDEYLAGTPAGWLYAEGVGISIIAGIAIFIGGSALLSGVVTVEIIGPPALIAGTGLAVGTVTTVTLPAWVIAIAVAVDIGILALLSHAVHVDAFGRPTTPSGQRIGPSGKPVYHYKNYPSRKRMIDGAKKPGKQYGKPVKSKPSEKGPKHVHPRGPSGRQVPQSPHSTCPQIQPKHVR